MKCAQKIPDQCDWPWNASLALASSGVKSKKWSELPAGVAGTGPFLSSIHFLFTLTLLSSSLYRLSKQLHVRLFWLNPLPSLLQPLVELLPRPSLWHPELWGWAGTQWFKNFPSGERIREMKATGTEPEKCWAREFQVETCVLGVEGGKDEQNWFTSRVEYSILANITYIIRITE